MSQPGGPRSSSSQHPQNPIVLEGAGIPYRRGCTVHCLLQLLPAAPDSGRQDSGHGSGSGTESLGNRRPTHQGHGLSDLRQDHLTGERHGKAGFCRLNGYLESAMLSVYDQQPIKKWVGRTRPDTASERLEKLWQLYVFWKQTPAGRKPQEIPPHVRKLVQKPQ